MDDLIQAFREILQTSASVPEAGRAFERLVRQIKGPPLRGRFCGSCGRARATQNGREVLHRLDCPERSV